MSPAIRRRLSCLGLALAGHLWLLRSGWIEPPKRREADAPPRPLGVHLVARTARASIEPAPRAHEPAPRPSANAARRVGNTVATPSGRPHDDAPRTVVEPGQAGLVTPADAPMTMPDATSTRRMLADLDRQQDKLSRTRERLEFPVHDDAGADRLGRAIGDAARAECADTLRHPSIVGLLSMARDTVRDKGCRW